MTTTLVILGGTGDLAGRFLLPAAVRLHASGALDGELLVIGAGRETLSADEYADHVRAHLAVHAPDVSDREREAFAAAVRYRQVDVTDPASVGAVVDLARTTPGPLTVYLALPTSLMLGTVRALARCDLPDGTRVAIEKPLGRDLASAVELNTALQAIDSSTGQTSIYRVDHALAMELLDVLGRPQLPGPDRAIERNGDQIEQVEVLWEETLALEGRAAFYDGAGALRDVMQNHQLQVLCAVAQPQQRDDAGTLDPAQARIAVLRTLRPLSPADVRTHTRRARYTAGRLVGDDHVGGSDVPDYRDERGVDPDRRTETFAEVTFAIDTPQWAGTRFVLRAGKALDGNRRGVLIHPRATAGDTRPVWLDVDHHDGDHLTGAETVAYQRVLHDLLAGGSAYAVGAHEAELAWQLFQPVLDAWAVDDVPLEDYPAGSTGPA